MHKILRLLKPTLYLTPAVFMTSCDGEAPKTAAELIDLGDRFSSADLAANPSAIATMPGFLLRDDELEHVVTGGGGDLGETTFDRNFGQNRVLTVNSSGQLLLSEGASIVGNISYIYANNHTNNTAAISLSPENSYPSTISDDEAGSDFNSRITTLVTNGGIGQGTIFDVINDPISTQDQVSSAIVSGIETLGLVANDAGFPVDGVYEDVDVTAVLLLKERNIIYQPTSTNADITASNTITGTYIVRDVVVPVCIELADPSVSLILFPASITTTSEGGETTDIDNGQLVTLTYETYGDFTLRLK